MSDDPKFDRFKPASPQIPGVPEAGQQVQLPKPPEEEEPPAGVTPKQWLMVGGGGLVVLIIMVFVMARVADRPAATPGALPPATAAENPSPAATVPASPVAALPAGPAPIAPGQVATVQELSRPWSSKRFLFRRLIGSEDTPALIVRLPGGSPQSGQGYWAFSLGQLGSCELQLVTDLAALARDYGLRSAHPMVVDPCSRTVFDPLQYGEVRDVLIRGAVVKGSAFRPPLSILVKVEGNAVSALQME